MLLRWLPWRSVVTRLARAHGFLDPIGLLARLRRFSQPSEVAEPLELLRAGMLFHARGLINTKAIQFNLDWIWPHWVERQFNPADPAFIPRAFSFSHINLTHRNWTAVGLPDVAFYPVVDPRGLVTPLFDGWSLDFWVLPAGEEPLLPAKLDHVRQTLRLPGDAAPAGATAPFADNLSLETVAARGKLRLMTRVALVMEESHPRCAIEVAVEGASEGWVVAALRPYNPEGVSPLDAIEVRRDRPGWLVNRRHRVRFDRAPAGWRASVYSRGDVFRRLAEKTEVRSVECEVGLASAAALFPLGEVGAKPLLLSVPIYDELHPKERPSIGTTVSWSEALAPLAKLRVPDASAQRLYDIAVTTLLLHAPGEVYPGPYTYKRFWFRDAAFILHALLALGATGRVRRALDLFPWRQTRDGYFLSQEGEWDSNGEALWSLKRYLECTGEPLPEAWVQPIERGARWITRKRLPKSHASAPGLLPAGFSAEHLGPNDHYFWDNLWGVAGLRAAAVLLRDVQPDLSAQFRREGEEFWQTLRTAFDQASERQPDHALPAAPRRRMDSGAVGTLVGDYPLQITPPGDARMKATAAWLRAHSSYGGAFFQNMIHSGQNAYLTLHLAQVLLRAGESEPAWELARTVAHLASPTGQWPEAIHPKTRGGCMGDGQHVWAAAEWVLYLRALFVREEGDRLVLLSGLPAEWLSQRATLAYGPTPTPAGTLRLSVEIAEPGRAAKLELQAAWRGEAPGYEIRLPGFSPLVVPPGSHAATFHLTPP